MTTQMTAREYYYSVAAPEEQGQSYSAFHHKLHLSNPRFRNRFETLKEVGVSEENWGASAPQYRFQPNLSNDLLLESLLKEMISIAEPSLANRLSAMFIAKRSDFVPNAYARLSKGDYSGDLVFFHVGLSDACFQYTLLLTELINLNLLRHKLNDDDPRVARLNNTCRRASRKLAEGQKWWIFYGDTVRIKEEFDLDLSAASGNYRVQAANLATYTDTFILGHEISHHLLGHTGKACDGRVINALPPECRLWQGASPQLLRSFRQTP